MRRANRPDQNAAQSPTEYTPGTDDLSWSSTATPLSSRTSDDSSQPTSGLTPTAVTTSSASSQPPPASSSPPSDTARTAWPSSNSTPACLYQSAVSEPTSAPTAAASGAPPASTTV